ncbi:MAG: CoA pyrophosphatase [Saprospiraceae bacterium]|nr:CoA pyrophosphatase [Saprospiraceae bacterium]
MEFRSALKERLKGPLPGRAAQLQMAAYAGRLSFDAPENPLRAAVLLLLHGQGPDHKTILIERVSHDQDKHSGQISFPGGKLDECDETLEACALREAHEEIGVIQEKIEVLGRLTDLYIPVSGFMVTPVVGVIDRLDALTPQPTEVAEILEVPLSMFFSQQTRQIRDLAIPNGIILRNVPYFDVYGKVLWGATAMMMNEFIQIVEDL